MSSRRFEEWQKWKNEQSWRVRSGTSYNVAEPGRMREEGRDGENGEERGGGGGGGKEDGDGDAASFVPAELPTVRGIILLSAALWSITVQVIARLQYVIVVLCRLALLHCAVYEVRMWLGWSPYWQL